VVPGPLGARLDVVHAGVDLRVQVAERLRDRLDPLPVRPRDREQRLGLGDVTGLDGVDELGGLLLQRDRLGVHVALVGDGGLLQRGVGVDLRGRVTGDGQVAADAVADHARLADRLVLAGRELHDQVALEAGADVLDLAHHAVALGVHVELSDLAATVGDRERAGPGLHVPAAQVAAVVGSLHRDRTGGVTGRGRRSVLGTAGERGQQEYGAGREASAGGDRVHGVPCRRTG
jgi:hypothetical protein